VTGHNPHGSSTRRARRVVLVAVGTTCATIVVPIVVLYVSTSYSSERLYGLLFFDKPLPFALTPEGPRWLSIIVELSPLKETTPILPRDIMCMAHPHITPSRLFLLSHASQYGRNIAAAFRRMLRMETILIASICDIEAFVLR